MIMDAEMKKKVAVYLSRTRQERATISYKGDLYLCTLQLFKPAHGQDVDAPPPSLSDAMLLPPPVELK